MEAAHDLSQYWMPHAHCIAGDPVTLCLHVLGDGFTALAYGLIPVLLVLTSWKYRDDYASDLRGLLLHGALFIVNCGLTHALSVWNWWNTNYTLSGAVAFSCAMVSMSFVFRLWRYLQNHPLSISPLPDQADHEP